jgi:hypothetical protein
MTHSSTSASSSASSGALLQEPVRVDAAVTAPSSPAPDLKQREEAFHDDWAASIDPREVLVDESFAAATCPEHRMELAVGTIRATISAPPRLFFVDTPSGVAADLGCIYELTVNPAGGSLLHVMLGFVELSHHGLASTVPAGALARTGKGRPPGAPWFEDATQPFIDALADFELRGGGDEALSTILAEARPRDSLTLWHLLWRVTPQQRSQVFARLAAIAPPPTGVTEPLVMALDGAALEEWWLDLARHW